MCYALSVWYNHLHLCVPLLWRTVAFVPFAAEVFSPENAPSAWKRLWCSDVSLGVEKCWLAYNVCSLWASLALNAAPQSKSVSQTFTGWCFSQWASLALNAAPLPKAECQSARLSLAVFLTVGFGGSSLSDMLHCTSSGLAGKVDRVSGAAKLSSWWKKCWFGFARQLKVNEDLGDFAGCHGNSIPGCNWLQQKRSTLLDGTHYIMKGNHCNQMLSFYNEG